MSVRIRTIVENRPQNQTLIRFKSANTVLRASRSYLDPANSGAGCLHCTSRKSRYRSLTSAIGGIPENICSI